MRARPEERMDAACYKEQVKPPFALGGYTRAHALSAVPGARATAVSSGLGSCYILGVGMWLGGKRPMPLRSCTCTCGPAVQSPHALAAEGSSLTVLLPISNELASWQRRLCSQRSLSDWTGCSCD